MAKTNQVKNNQMVPEKVHYLNQLFMGQVYSKEHPKQLNLKM